MGYYSDACLVFSPKGYDCFTIKLETIEKDVRDFVIDFLAAADDIKIYQDQHLFFWKGVKWYPQFPEIENLYKLLKSIDENLYRLKIVGEEGDTEEYGYFLSDFHPLFNFSITYEDPNEELIRKYGTTYLTVEDIIEIYGLHETSAHDLLLDLDKILRHELIKHAHSIIRKHLKGNKSAYGNGR